MKLALIAIATQMTLLVALVALLAVIATSPQYVVMPRCQEDATIVPGGDFKDGYWSDYQCGPSVDDLP